MSLLRFNEAVMPDQNTSFSLEVDEEEKIGIYASEEETLQNFVRLLLEAEDETTECNIEPEERCIVSDVAPESDLEVKQYFKHRVKHLFHYLDHYERLNIKLTKMMSPVQMPSMLEQIEEMERKLNAWEAWEVDEEINQWIEWLGFKGDQTVNELSLQDQKRVDCCASILRPVRLLILDRPFRWFNEKESRQLIDHLKKWAQTLIITSQHEPLLTQLVDRKVNLPEN